MMMLVPSGGEGDRVLLFLRDGTMTSGELLAVRDSSVVISAHRIGLPDKTLENRPELLADIQWGQMQRAEVQEGSHGGIGALAGLGAGLVIGFVISPQATGNDPVGKSLSSFTTIAIMSGTGLLGAALGAGIGGAFPRTELEITVEQPEDLAQLLPYARYPAEEPQFLRSAGVAEGP